MSGGYILVLTIYFILFCQVYVYTELSIIVLQKKKK